MTWWSRHDPVNMTQGHTDHWAKMKLKVIISHHITYYAKLSASEKLQQRKQTIILQILAYSPENRNSVYRKKFSWSSKKEKYACLKCVVVIVKGHAVHSLEQRRIYFTYNENFIFSFALVYICRYTCHYILKCGTIQSVARWLSLCMCLKQLYDAVCRLLETY